MSHSSVRQRRSKVNGILLSARKSSLWLCLRLLGTTLPASGKCFLARIRPDLDTFSHASAVCFHAGYASVHAVETNHSTTILHQRRFLALVSLVTLFDYDFIFIRARRCTLRCSCNKLFGNVRCSEIYNSVSS